MLFNILECFEVLQSLIAFRMLIVNNCFATYNQLFKFLACHAGIFIDIFKVDILRKDTCILCNCLCCIDIVSSAHTYSDAGIVALTDSPLDSFAKRVLQTIDANHGQILF